MSNNKEWITTTGIARLCGVSRITVERYVSKGRLKPVATVGKVKLFDAARAQDFFSNDAEVLVNRAKSRGKAVTLTVTVAE